MVPPLSQWQGAALIVGALAVGCCLRRLRKRRGCEKHNYRQVGTILRENSRPLRKRRSTRSVSQSLNENNGRSLSYGFLRVLRVFVVEVVSVPSVATHSSPR